MAEITKGTLRTRFQGYRGSLPLEEASARSSAICENIMSTGLLDRPGLVLLYSAMLDAGEADVSDLVGHLFGQQRDIALPVILEFSGYTGRRRLDLRMCSPGQELTMNSWGIGEPVSGTVIPISDISVAVIPALGAGRNMHRIGHGSGYYDEILRNAKCTTICPVYSGCLVESVPFEEHDIQVDYIATETEIIGRDRAL